MTPPIDPCAQCEQPGVLLAPSEPARTNGTLVLVMHVRCKCRVRYSVHELPELLSFEVGERVAAEAVAQWNALQQTERAASR